MVLKIAIKLPFAQKSLVFTKGVLWGNRPYPGLNSTYRAYVSFHAKCGRFAICWRSGIIQHACSPVLARSANLPEGLYIFMIKLQHGSDKLLTSLLDIAQRLAYCNRLSVLARDAIYTSRAYARPIRCQCPSVCDGSALAHYIANLGFKFRSQFTAHCGRGACGREGRDHRREEWRDHLALCYSHC